MYNEMQTYEPDEGEEWECPPDVPGCMDWYYEKDEWYEEPYCDCDPTMDPDCMCDDMTHDECTCDWENDPDCICDDMHTHECTCDPTMDPDCMCDPNDMGECDGEWIDCGMSENMQLPECANPDFCDNHPNHCNCMEPGATAGGDPNDPSTGGDPNDPNAGATNDPNM